MLLLWVVSILAVVISVVMVTSWYISAMVTTSSHWIPNCYILLFLLKEWLFFFIIIMMVKMLSESYRFSGMKQEFHDFKNDFSSQLSQLPKSFCLMFGVEVWRWSLWKISSIMEWYLQNQISYYPLNFCYSFFGGWFSFWK